MRTRHSLLGGSNADRWINCPPSALAEQNHPDTTGATTVEDTIAHALAEHKLRCFFHLEPKRKPVIPDEYAAEMERHTDAYVSFIASHIPQGSQLWVETRVRFDQWVAGGFATVDAIAITDNALHVFDFTYDKNTQAEAGNHSYLKLYALGAYQMVRNLYSIEKIYGHIFRPRRDHVSSMHINLDELLDWAKNTVRPAGDQAWRGEGRRKTGLWCTFCRARTSCEEHAIENLQHPIHTKDNPNSHHFL
ncbi:DUF2800 domain-containing protein [Trueperella sp. LYQ143]|uniref:DUF2800 domain-containing protein n=1 Tax=Trueperella sp. LYQ143 TaxID=3391059 RepID=UPI003983CECA